MGPTQPQLDDPKQFEVRSGVPILDVHERNGWVVDANRLRLVCENSNRRAARGELGLLLIGHTTDDGKEVDQPPLAGYVQHYRMGEWNGRPCILADLFYARDKLPQALGYPRRSVEAIYSDANPANNFIDAVSLLVRAPARDLGYVSYRAGNIKKERYSMATDIASPGITEADIPGLQDFMKRNAIADMAEGIRSFLKAKADGTDKPGDDEITQADFPGIDRYCKQHKVDATNPHAYEVALERYKADRKAGTLNRT